MKRILIWLALIEIYLVIVVAAVAQNPVVPYRSPRATFTTSTGQPLSGGCIFTYQGGTTTPQATYTDYTGSTANPNPVILDTTGSAVMWLGSNSYKFVAYSNGGYNCASGYLQWTVDQVPGDAFLNGTISGATITNPTISGGTQTGTAISGSTVAGSNINSTPIGATAPAAGAFTSITGVLDALGNISAPTSFNATNYSSFTMTLTSNISATYISGGSTGQIINFDICQNNPGGTNTFAWPSSFSSYPAVNPSPGVCTLAGFLYNGTNWLNIYSYTSPSAVLVAPYVALTPTATPIFHTDEYSNFSMLLSYSVSSSTLTATNYPITGQPISITLCQPIGGRSTVVWPTNLLNPPTMAVGTGACTSLVAIYNGTNWQTVSTNNSQPAYLGLQSNYFQAVGTQPTITGCGTISAQVGGNTAGTFATSATSCTPVLTGLASTTNYPPNGYNCTLSDQTHALSTPVVPNISSTYNSATFANFTTTSGDVIAFSCLAF